MSANFLNQLVGSFAMPAAENPTVAIMEAAFRHHGLDWRYINCEVAPDNLRDAVKGAYAMGWAGFNCSIPHKVAVIEHIDELGNCLQPALVIGIFVIILAQRFLHTARFIDPSQPPFRIEQQHHHRVDTLFPMGRDVIMRCRLYRTGR